jgi:thioredoxin reductase
VHRLTTKVEALERSEKGWQARTTQGDIWSARAVLLATGVIDHHPVIEGYNERWGECIHHCPYCHGWEMRDLPLAVLAQGEAAQHLAPLLRGWSNDVILLTHGKTLSEEVMQHLKPYNIPLYTSPIRRLEGAGTSLEVIRLEDGTALKRQGLFVAAEQSLPPLITSLGLELNGGYIRVDAMQKTSLPMLWAAGDCTSRMQQVLEAAAQGGRAGAIINATLTLQPQG